MAARFFCSIPDAVAVRDPYDEVFELFTTETSDAPWAHNRSVAQNSTRLEIELDYTPAPSPVASRPGSRPDSRASLSMNNLVFSSDGSISGSAVSSESTVLGTTALDDSSSTNVKTSRTKTPVGKPSLGSRKSSRKELFGKPASLKKPVVIHQSLSTLSQPGQTGTVVWDSSILMSKFLLSIQGLSVGCYLHQQQQQDQMDHSDGMIDQQQIRRLEEQAEHLSVSEDGNLERKNEGSIPGPQATPSSSTLDPSTRRKLELNISREDQQRHRMEHAQNHSEEDTDEVDDGMDDEDADLDSGAQNEADQRLVFDPAETSILELGSGCGLLGIVMAELCQDLLLTDQKPVLPLLVKNLRKNLDKKYFDQDSTAEEAVSTPSAPLKKKSREGQSASSSLTSSTIKPCHIQVQELVWGQDLDQDLKRGLGVDFVVATDVVYNESVVPKLVDTLLELCMVRERVRHELAVGHGDTYERLSALADTLIDNDSRRRRRPLKRTVVLLAQELRTDYVHLAFLERLEIAGFQMMRMPKQIMDPDFHSGYAIYACFLKKPIGRNL